jgi:hypothetical protein
MAKELPYFKFNAAEWISGGVTLEDLTAQGAFINICAYYWFKSGCLTLTEIKRRLKLKQATLDALVNGNHIKVYGEQVEISFLKEQFDERGHKSKVNSINGSKGGAPKGNKNAEKNNREQAKTTNIEENKNREEKEEKRTEENAHDFDSIFLKAFDENTCESYKLAFRGFDLGAELQKFRIKCDNDKAKYYGRDVGGLRTAFQYQLQNLRQNGKRKSGTLKDGNDHIDELLRKEFGAQGATG